MKRLLLTIFGWFAGEMAVISRKSANALGTFQSVVDQIEATKAHIDEVATKKQQKISLLMSHLETLNQQKASNKKISDKINEFLHGE